MLDSNVVDELLADAELLSVVLAAVEEGRVELVVTHVQIDELRAVPGDARRYQLLEILSVAASTEISTAGFVLDLSRLGHGRPFSEPDAERHRAFVGLSGRRAKDALILATADAEGLPLVTMERKSRNLRRFRAAFPSVELLGVDDLRRAAQD